MATRATASRCYNSCALPGVPLKLEPQLGVTKILRVRVIGSVNEFYNLAP